MMTITTNKDALAALGEQLNKIIYSPMPEHLKGMTKLEMQRYFNAQQDEERKRRKTGIQL